MKKVIYIGGKVSGLPMDQVQAKFFRVQQQIEAAGHHPINPVLRVQTLRKQNDTWENIMRLCIGDLMHAHELWLLPCWKDSPGARFERDTAMRLGLQIVYL